MTLNGWISTTQAAELANYRQGHVRRLARQGAIKAHQVGGIWLIGRDALLQYQARAKPERPRRKKTD